MNQANMLVNISLFDIVDQESPRLCWPFSGLFIYNINLNLSPHKKRQMKMNKKFIYLRVQIDTTGLALFAEEPKPSAKAQKPSAKSSQKILSRQRGPLPRAFYRALGKAFAEGQHGTRQRKATVMAFPLDGVFAEGHHLCPRQRKCADFFFQKILCRGLQCGPRQRLILCRGLQ